MEWKVDFRIFCCIFFFFSFTHSTNDIVINEPSTSDLQLASTMTRSYLFQSSAYFIARGCKKKVCRRTIDCYFNLLFIRYLLFLEATKWSLSLPACTIGASRILSITLQKFPPGSKNLSVEKKILQTFLLRLDISNLVEFGTSNWMAWSITTRDVTPIRFFLLSLALQSRITR